MTLLSYEIFRAVVLQGSFQKASAILNLTPSAVSHAISSMERELGFSLFVRGKSGVTLTSCGETLLPYIQSVLSSEESLRQAAAQLGGLQKGLVKLGAFNSVCTAWIPGIVKGFSLHYPQVELEVYQGTYEEVYGWIKDGTVDLGFLSQPAAKGLEFQPLYQDRLVCVAPPGLQTKAPGVITIEELSRMDFVSQRSSCDADIQSLQTKHNFTVRAKCYVVDDMATFAMSAAGMGVCVLSSLALTWMPFELATYPIEPPEYRTIGLAFSKPENMAPAVRSMRAYIVEYISRRYGDGKAPDGERVLC